MDRILESHDYNLFDMMSFNRDVKKTRNLEKSMKIHGWIPAYPAHVAKKGGKLLIKAGHHRFFVARKLNIPVKYVICTDNISIYELEKATTPWNMQDYLDSHCRNGEREYLAVKEYCDETGIGVSNAMSMLGGHSAGSGNFGLMFKMGEFKIKKDSNHADTVRDIVLCFKKYGVPFYNTNLLVQAISRVAWVKEFESSRMKSKIKICAGFVEKKANLEQYESMLEEIYNRQSKSKIPLKFLADAAAKNRNAVGKSQKP
jgi:hypothetical protein